MGNKYSKVNSFSSGIAEMSPGKAGSVKPGDPQPLTAAPPPRLLDPLRSAIRVRHDSIRTESAYVDWARRFILFNEKRHPSEMGAAEVSAFLSHLAFDRGVSPSTQNQARFALLLWRRRLSAGVRARQSVCR